MNLKKLSKKNSGFTLIELLIAITISLMIILGASSIFKFVILSWNKTSKGLEALEKISSVEHMLRTQFENFEPIKDDRNNVIFRGNENELTFATNDSGSYEDGLVIVNYKYLQEDKQLRVCISNINDYKDLKGMFSDIEDFNCFKINDIGNFSIQYDTGKEDTADNLFNSLPKAMIISVNIEYDENQMVKRDFYVYAEQ